MPTYRAATTYVEYTLEITDQVMDKRMRDNVQAKIHKRMCLLPGLCSVHSNCSVSILTYQARLQPLEFSTRYFAKPFISSQYSRGRAFLTVVVEL